LPNFMNIYQLVQTLLVWEAQSGRQTAWWPSVSHFPFSTKVG
jgi:hypothetical protein